MSLDRSSLWNGKYLDIKTYLDYKYEMIMPRHKPACIIPFYTSGNTINVIVRKEWCPPYFETWGEGSLTYTLITGGIEDGEEPQTAAFREMYEEAGITSNDYEIIKSIHVPIWKNTTDAVSMYLVKLNSFSAEVPKGDGSENEARSKSLHIPFHEYHNIIFRNDPHDFLFLFGYHLISNISK